MENRDTSKGRGSSRSNNKRRNSNSRYASSNANSTQGKRQGAGKPANKKKKKQEVALDPSLFIKKAVPIEERHYESPRNIKDLPVDNSLLYNLLEKGYQKPTEIQDKTLEAILDKRDLMGIAKTGTGKTGAFLIPLVHDLVGARAAGQILIIVPTRELACQVEDEFKSMTEGLRLYSNCFIGGTNINRDLDKLKRQSHVIIGTPGRLNDLANRGALRLKSFSTLVLDEFDRLLDMGFWNDVKRLVQQMTQKEQTILFSATEERQQRTMIASLLDDPVEVRVSSGDVTADHIDQDVVIVKEGEKKIDVLLDMLNDETFEKVIVFAETKRWVNTIFKKLISKGVKVGQIHGDKTQNYRQKALDKFKQGELNVLVATDVAARGLDISDVSHVINYQPPRTVDSYIHRIGRTGRAGKTGKAFTFIS